MTVIVNGNPIPANWFWPPNTDKTLRLEIADSRPLYEIAREFENANEIIKLSSAEGDEKYIDNGRVISILRPDANAPEAQIILERGEKVEYNHSQNG